MIFFFNVPSLHELKTLSCSNNLLRFDVEIAPVRYFGMAQTS